MPWLALITLITGGLFLMTARSDSGLPRGIRNNNPGNIRRTGTQWQGMASQQTDPAFIVFSSPHWGIRALARTLRTYRQTHGLNTVREIITRWAPPVENNTTAYVTHAARALGVDPDAALVFDQAQLRALVTVIIQHENGMQPYSNQVLDEGIRAGWA